MPAPTLCPHHRGLLLNKESHLLSVGPVSNRPFGPGTRASHDHSFHLCNVRSPCLMLPLQRAGAVPAWSWWRSVFQGRCCLSWEVALGWLGGSAAGGVSLGSEMGAAWARSNGRTTRPQAGWQVTPNPEGPPPRPNQIKLSIHGSSQSPRPLFLQSLRSRKGKRKGASFSAWC